MKTRLVKKLMCRPLDQLPSYWLKKLIEGKNRRIEKAIKMYEKLKTKNL